MSLRYSQTSGVDGEAHFGSQKFILLSLFEPISTKAIPNSVCYGVLLPHQMQRLILYSFCLHSPRLDLTRFLFWDLGMRCERFVGPSLAHHRGKFWDIQAGQECSICVIRASHKVLIYWQACSLPKEIPLGDTKPELQQYLPISWKLFLHSGKGLLSDEAEYILWQQFPLQSLS